MSSRGSGFRTGVGNIPTQSESPQIKMASRHGKEGIVKKSHRLFWLRLWASAWVLMMLAATALMADAQEPSGWIRMHAIPLRTVEANHGFDDLQPLAKVVGDARIVALGEATHGTREFFQLKHRMIEYLASQKGFTIFSIEANMPEAYRLNDFVLNGKGDPKQLLKGMYFWTWDTEEVLDMIRWMREFNRSGKGRIEFTGFDMQTPNVSMELVRTFVKQKEPAYLDSLNRTYSDIERLQKAESPGQGGFGVATASFPVKLAAGHHIKYSGFVRTESVTQGYAGLWWRTDGENGKLIALDNMADRGPKGTTDWKRYEISVDVPANATNIYFGAIHPGNGTAWFDSLQVEIDGVLYTDSSAFDLDFESEGIRGFHTGGKGYEATIDKAVAHTGKQSLRSKLMDTPVESPGGAVEQMRLSLACEDILKHLENKRANFLQTSNAKEVDWVIQNARLVLQYAQLKTGRQSRDESMAENMKWIADQNPGAKMILWAHNGHVSYKAPPGFNPMGGYLHAKFGSALVTFGFSFNEGSFRAVEMGKSLHEFTVEPAPEGSLDRALASAGIPLFALDLRQIPKEGKVAQWFAEPHATRSIGSVYDDADSASYWSSLRWQDAFDVILFVEKTTASRGNP
jgi:erythromycin esterase-like protein